MEFQCGAGERQAGQRGSDWRIAGRLCLNHRHRRPSPEVIRKRTALPENVMANTLLPLEERNLTPDQVEALDKRRELGHTFLVIAGQFSVIATILLLWVGQDLTYSPGWAHPMAYYFFLALALIAGFGIAGLLLRKGTPRID